VFNWIWYEEDFNIKNPIEKVKIDANRIPPLAEIPTDNIQALLNNCSHRRYELRDRAIIRTLFDSGLRATELCNLNVQDVNLTTGQVTIWHGKGNKFGISFIGQSSKNAIKEYLDTRDNVNPKEPLFPNQEGKE
jgi:site-specific recombinase XerC